MKIDIKDFSSRDEIISAFPIIHQMYSKMNKDIYISYIDDMTKGNNYNMIGAYNNNKLVGIASYWVLTRFYCGKYIQIGNMVVDKNFRSNGIGAKLLKYVENKGRELGCQRYILDSYTENKKSHKLYFKEGFYVEGLHFMKDL